LAHKPALQHLYSAYWSHLVCCGLVHAGRITAAAKEHHGQCANNYNFFYKQLTIIITNIRHAINGILQSTNNCHKPMSERPRQLSCCCLPTLSPYSHACLAFSRKITQSFFFTLK